MKVGIKETYKFYLFVEFSSTLYITSYGTSIPNKYITNYIPISLNNENTDSKNCSLFGFEVKFNFDNYINGFGELVFFLWIILILNNNFKTVLQLNMFYALSCVIITYYPNVNELMT